MGLMNINQLMNINESARIFPRPYKLTFDLLTLKVVSESRRGLPVCQFWSPCLSVLELFPMYATDSKVK